MQTSEVRTDVVIPERGMRSRQMKYPFESMSKGQVRVITLDDGDTDLTVEKLKKNVVNAAKAYEQRLGKLKDGAKVKDFAVWVDLTETFGEEGPQMGKAVFIGCREDRTAEKMLETEAHAEVAAVEETATPKKKAKK